MLYAHPTLERRDAGMSEATRLETRLRKALAISDPFAQFLALEEVLTAIDAFRASVTELRDISAHNANLAGVSYLRLGAAVGRSKSHGQQMCNAGRRYSEEEKDG